MPQDAQYLCPGDGLTISRGVHLGRLANLYPACRDCEHRTDSGALGKALFWPQAHAERQACVGDPFSDDGLAGWVPGQIDFRTIGQFARAAGNAWRAQAAAEADAEPAIVVGCDGRPLACELLAAASEGLRLAGCRAIEVEAVTAPALALAVRDCRAAGGLLVGNPCGMPHVVGVRLWSRGGVPASAGGSLEWVRREFAAGAPRPTRRAGGLARHVARTSYLDHYRGLFHALRPLSFVLDTASAVLHEYAAQLTAATACRILAPQPRRAAGSQDAPGSTRESQSARSAAAALPDVPARRLAWMAEQVPAQRADFGLWIDGDGLRLQLIDERGRIVAADRLLAGLARIELAGRDDAAVVVENTTSPRALSALAASGIRTIQAEPLAEAMFQALEQSGATLGGGPSGCFWFATPCPAPDALAMLAWLLALLSRADRPLSNVLDDAKV